ncbi:peptide/nickel transport system substrate-binding protein [Antricoccus suffuscus]|uniref:Peptide/nickel transport system substrate-binding protein n=1 Tax=Antricoccus suffuscus TaxID=1629062 RepID=A0A2T1A439_9ACTN|nr:ABC transporter substrate-binding protein [Antricoccus suffuscus]PRZ43068.1 peptide/nickel transport system substrate-binding protein [Antricoccus suffuscus]
MNRLTVKLIALLTALVAVTTACGAGNAGSSDPTHLTWGWGMPSSWDPVASTAGADVHSLSLVYSGLTKQDPDGKAVPEAAKSWAYNDDGSAITFTLRDGLKFSDGTALDATAVKKSLERGRDAEYSTKRAQLAIIASIDVLSPTEVRLTLTQPDYQIPDLLAGLTGMIVSPKAFESDPKSLATKPVGSGPFELTSYTPGSEAQLKKYDGYYNAADIHIKTLTQKQPADDSVIIAGLQSGQYDIAVIPPSQVEAAKKAGFDVDVNKVLTVRTLDINNTVAPFDNPKVVEAIKYALDRKALVDKAFFGFGDPNYQPFPSGYVANNPALDNLYPHDVKKAKSLLAEAGYPNGVDLTLTSYDTGGLAEQIVSQLGEAGINVKIQTLPLAQASQQIYIKREAPFALDSFSGRESPAQAMEVLFGPEGLMNLGRNTPPEVVTAMQKISTTPTDDPSYPTVVQDAVAVAVKAMPNAFLFSWPRIFARNKDVKGFTPYIGAQRFDGTKIEAS